MRRGYARSEARNAAVRAGLTPLSPGERPLGLRVAVALTGVLALVNLAGFVAGIEIDGDRPSAVATVIFAAVMLALAFGMWVRNYWAVLAFEALLGITVTLAALSLLVASNVEAVAVCLLIIVVGGWLFWKLVRVMGRLQAPQPTR
jgi:hypothetical protein